MEHGLATSSPLPTQSQQSYYVLCLLMAENPCSCRARWYFGPVTLWMLVSIQLFASRPALPMQICLINAGYLPWLCSKITDSLGEPFSVLLGTESRRELQSDRAEEASISIQLNLVIPETLRVFMKKESYGLFGDVITQGLVKAF